MVAKKTNKTEYGVIVNCEFADVLDTPEQGAPLICQLNAGRRVKKVSKPNKRFVGVEVTNSVIGFVDKEFIK